MIAKWRDMLKTVLSESESTIKKSAVEDYYSSLRWWVKGGEYVLLAYLDTTGLIKAKHADISNNY